MLVTVTLTSVIFSILIIMCWLYYDGFFDKVTIVKTGQPWGNSEIIAYKCIAGNRYNFRKLFSEIKSIVPHGRIFVLFYGNVCLPRSPKAHSLYAIGFTVKFEDYKVWIYKGFKLFLLKQIYSALLVSYPLRCRFSESLAVLRIYPWLCKYIMERNLCAHPSIEVYDYKKKEVTFILPLTRQSCFYVPEAADLSSR